MSSVELIETQPVDGATGDAHLVLSMARENADVLIGAGLHPPFAVVMPPEGAPSLMLPNQVQPDWTLSWGDPETDPEIDSELDRLVAIVRACRAGLLAVAFVSHGRGELLVTAEHRDGVTLPTGWLPRVWTTELP